MAALVLMSWAFIAEAMCSFTAAVRSIAFYFDCERKMREMQARHDEEIRALRAEMEAMQYDTRARCKQAATQAAFMIWVLVAVPVFYTAFYYPHTCIVFK